MELQELFLQATVDSKALTEKPDNETLLKYIKINLLIKKKF